MPLTRRRDDSDSAEDPDLATAKVRSDPFLLSMYRHSLDRMVEGLALPADRTGLRVLEIGAAGGVTKEVHPWIETTDVRAATGVDRIVDGAVMPYDDASVDGLIAKDALHHIPDPRAHFAEVVRILRPGARAVYLEPNWNRLSRLIFTHLHPEPFDDSVTEWARESEHPMDSNQALAYMVFERDLATFTADFPQLELVETSLCNGLSFLASGGVHSRTPAPAGPLIALRAWECKRPAVLQRTALNRIIVLRKRA